MAQVPTGSTFFIATAFGSAMTVTAITNATEAIVSATAHGFANGDIVEMTSSWGRLQKRAYRAKSVAANTFVLEGADTTNVTFFPAGGGAGSARKVSTLVQITTVMNPNASGGEAKKVTYKFIESDVEYSINDGFSAVNRSMELDADSIGSPGYTALKSLTEIQSDTILKTISKNGAFTLLPCTVALNEEVVYQDGQINRVKVDFSGNNKSTRYAS
jgi:hypothetical protein